MTLVFPFSYIHFLLTYTYAPRRVALMHGPSYSLILCLRAFSSFLLSRG